MHLSLTNSAGMSMSMSMGVSEWVCEWVRVCGYMTSTMDIQTSLGEKLLIYLYTEACPLSQHG